MFFPYDIEHDGPSIISKSAKLTEVKVCTLVCIKTIYSKKNLLNVFKTIIITMLKKEK